MVHQVSEEEFKRIVQSEDIVVVDFSAVWCVPCKYVGQVLDQDVGPALEGKATIVKVDVDECKELARSLNIRSVPTVMIYHKGQRLVFEGPGGEQDRIIGFHPQLHNIIIGLVESLLE